MVKHPKPLPKPGGWYIIGGDGLRLNQSLDASQPKKIARLPVRMSGQPSK